MISKFIAAATILAAFACAPSAHADWQFTHWGMSPDAVIEAAEENGVSVKRFEPKSRDENGRKVLVNGEYNAGQLQFFLTFWFRDEQLDAVTLYLYVDDDTDRVARLENELLKKYGQPFAVRQDDKAARRWWTVGDDQVYLEMLLYKQTPSSAEIHYSPRASAENQGL